MPTVKTPLFTETYTGIDKSVLNDKQARRVNCYLNELSAVTSLPATESVYDLSGLAARNNAVTGLYYARFLTGDRLLVAIDQWLWSMQNTGAAITVGSYMGVILGATGEPVKFVTDRTNLLIATGGPLVYGTSSATLGALSTVSPGCPAASTHVVMLDGYAIANERGTNRFQWSETPGVANNIIDWPASNYQEAAGGNDIIQAIAVRNRELFLIGAETVEILENDGTTPFIRVAGGFMDTGCIAPYSVVTTEDGVYWLSHKRKFVMYDGQSLKQISSQFDGQIAKWKNVSDCRAEAVEVDGISFIWFYFPGERKILCLNQSNNTWSERSYWDPELGIWDRWIGSCTLHIPDWATTIVGSSSAAKLFKFSDSDISYQEGDREYPLRIFHQSGNLDYGTSKRKRSNVLRLRIRKVLDGAAIDPAQGKLFIRWRDDGRQDWSNVHEIDMGFNRDSEIVFQLHRTGIYRTRQYEIYGTPHCRSIYCDAEEDIDVLLS